MGSCSTPAPKLQISRAVTLFRVAEGRLDTVMPETLADGGQADAVVDEVGGMGVSELMDGAGGADGLAVPGPTGLG